MPAQHLWLPIIGIGLTNILYLYPYYKALQIEDTSIVSAFFSLGKIIIPILAFIFVGEILSFKQYLGIGLIIFCNVLLGIHRYGKKVRMNRAIYLILFASTILAVEGVLFKYMFEQGIRIGTAVGGQLIITSALGVSLLFFSRFRKHIKESREVFKQSLPIFLTEELFTFFAVVVEAYAVKLAPLSLVKAIGMTIPIFILSYTLAVKKRRTKVFHENVKLSTLLKKVPIYALIIFGVILVGFWD